MNLFPFLVKICTTTTTIFVTTADDALWLIPFITSPSLCTTNKLINAFTFICTIQLLVIIAALLVHILGSLVIEKIADHEEEKCLHIIAATITWMIVFYFYFKKKCKKRKSTENKELDTKDCGDTKNYQSLNDSMNGSSSSDSSVGYEELDIGNDEARPFTVFSLTLLGGLDELTYFPSLIIGKTFTPIELSIGALIACILIIIIITTILSTCRPILEYFDSIPLYYIISILAVFLTIDAVLDFL